MAAKKTISVPVYDMTGAEVSKLSLDASVFGVEAHQQAMFDAVQVEQANARQATAKTKVRHEVSGGGKKPWRQKVQVEHVLVAQDHLSGSAAEQSSVQSEIKTSRFPKIRKNTSWQLSPLLA